MARIHVLKSVNNKDTIDGRIPQRKLRFGNQRRAIWSPVRPLDNALAVGHERGTYTGFAVEDLQKRGSVAKADNVHIGEVIPALTDTARDDAARKLPERRRVKIPKLRDVVIHEWPGSLSLFPI